MLFLPFPRATVRKLRIWSRFVDSLFSLKFVTLNAHLFQFLLFLLVCLCFLCHVSKKKLSKFQPPLISFIQLPRVTFRLDIDFQVFKYREASSMVRFYTPAELVVNYRSRSSGDEVAAAGSVFFIYLRSDKTWLTNFLFVSFLKLNIERLPKRWRYREKKITCIHAGINTRIKIITFNLNWFSL